MLYLCILLIINKYNDQGQEPYGSTSISHYSSVYIVQIFSHPTIDVKKKK